MTQANPTSIKVYAYISAAWVELDDMGGAIGASMSNGMTDNLPTTRLADPGRLTLSLNNSTGAYSPDGPSALAGWKKGLPLKLVITYDGVEKVFPYKIDDIQINPSLDDQSVNIIAVDWLEDATTYPIVNPSLLQDARADEGIAEMVSNMPLQPTSQSLARGLYKFPTQFDTVRGNTKAYNEFAKLALSETGYIYQKRNGELKFESADYRNGARTLSTIPKTYANSGFLLKEDGDKLLKEDSGKIVLDESETFDVDNTMTDINVIYGRGIVNRWVTSAYPKRIDTESALLYESPTPIFLPAGATKTFRAFYVNPNGGRGINAVPPVQDNYTQSILQFEGDTDNSDVIDDIGNVWTNEGIDLTGNVKKFGERGGYFDGGGAYITTPHKERWEFGSGDFTVAWWEWRFSTTINLSVMSRNKDDISPAWVFGYSDGTNSRVYISSDGATWDIANGRTFGAITINTWVHYEISRSGNNFYMFKDGTLTDSWTSSATIFASSSVLTIGRHNSLDIVATLDDFVIIKGRALHTENFTPSTNPYQLEGTYGTMWSEQDLTGTELTDNLTTTVEYGTEGAIYTIENTSDTDGGWVNVKTYGLGIYSDSSIDNTQEDSDSIQEYGYANSGIQQQYQYDLYSGILEGERVIELEKQPRTVLNSISMFANSSPENMQAFLRMEAGDLVRVVNDRVGIDAWCYIQGIAAEINGFIINFTWILKQAFLLASGLSAMVVEFASGTDAITYNYMPQVGDDSVLKRGFSAWFYLDTLSATDDRIILSTHSGAAGVVLFIENHATNRYVAYYSTRTSTLGRWLNASNQFSLSAWVHVFVYHDLTTVTNDPIILVNGAVQTLTESDTPAGTLLSEEGNQLVIGNWHTVNNDYNRAFDGKIKDVRVYDFSKTNRSPAEIAAAIYAEGAYGDENYSGMVFQSFAVRTADLTEYTDLTLTENTKVLDAYNGYVGTPSGSPVTRTP